MHTDTHTTMRKSVQHQTCKSPCGSPSRQGLSMARVRASQIMTRCCYLGGDMTFEIHSPVKKDVSVVTWDVMVKHFQIVLCSECFCENVCWVLVRPPRVTLMRAPQCWQQIFVFAPLLAKHSPSTLMGAFNVTPRAAKTLA